MRHIIWDWNGTLLVDQCVVLSSVNAALQVIGCEAITLREYRQLPKRPVKSFYERIYGQSISEKQWTKMDTVYHDAYRKTMNLACLAADTDVVLNRVLTLGFTQSLLSMSPHDDLLRTVDDHGLLSFFSRIDGERGECGGEKADHLEEHVVKLERELGLMRSEVIAIGDTVDDATAAQHVGIGCILLETDTYTAAILNRQGVPVINSLSGAVRLIESGA